MHFDPHGLGCTDAGEIDQPLDPHDFATETLLSDHTVEAERDLNRISPTQAVTEFYI